VSAALPSAKVLVAEPLSETGLAVLSRAGLADAVAHVEGIETARLVNLW
jgi:hypothetical protein